MTTKNIFRTSPGKKLLVALTGLLMSGFVLTHMTGNMLILLGPETYNKYSYMLTSNELIYIAEAALVLFFFVHVFFAVSLAADNQRARPVAPYQLPRPGMPQRASFASRSMIYTGALVFAFLVLHLWTFKYGTHYPVTYNGVVMRDLYRLINEKFHEPLYVAWYLFSLVILGIHLSHGVAASFQSLGFFSVRNLALKRVGYAFTVFVILGFMSQPLYVLLLVPAGAQ